MTKIFLASFLMSITLLSTACLYDDEEGACVSDVNNSGRQYCYSNYDKSECDTNNANNLNGANWYFHSGQTCADRGLNEGSN